MRISFLMMGILWILLPSLRAERWENGFSVPDPYTSVYEITEMVTDTIPFKDRFGNFVEEKNTNPFDLDDPAGIEKNVEYDPQTGLYIITEKIGDEFFRAPTYMTFDEYMEWTRKEQERAYFERLAGISQGDRNSSGKVDPVSIVDISDDIIDRLFGGSEVDLKPQGNVDLTFGYDYYKQENPILPIRRQRNGGFDFDMDIQVNVDGKIGEKLGTAFNYNTRSTFDFENKLKLNYNSDLFSEDEIIKNIEAGDVALPLRSELIEGSQNLFGIKTDLQFGHLRLTAIASQQRSEQNDLVIQGGSVLQEFEVPIDQYDENRHFFLSQFNRETFEIGLSNIPQIISLFNVTRLEVWVTNTKTQTTNVRDILAIADLGEYDNMTIDNPEDWRTNDINQDICNIGILPTNGVNRIIDEIRANDQNRLIQNAVNTLTGPNFRFSQIKDFERVRARRLSPQEYSFHPELGFISLNLRLQPDQVLGVAYEYTYNGKVFQVGELSQDIANIDSSENQQVLFVKMLKSTNANVQLPYWDLMMKNFYYIGGSDLNPEEFQLDVFYEDPGKGFKRFLPDFTNLENQPILTILNLDNLNVQGDPQPDGKFDFATGLTINPRQGRIMFPVLEPFGSTLRGKLVEAGADPMLIDSLIYQQLYDSTVTKAREFPEFNRFTIKGEAKTSSNSEISLGAFNIPQGSVRVTAGGQRLIENQDYVVDYNIGRIRILNDNYLQPGTPIRVSFEDNALFNFNKKTMIGLRADYEVSKKMNIGGTYMHLFERPYTQKVNIGDDPINNRVYGLDMNFSDEAPFLTKLVDKIPGINTKEKSQINFQAEMAALKPGHSRAINAGKKDDDGIVYLDDFEGTSSNFDLRTPVNAWQIASTPTMAKIDGVDRFPESMNSSDLLSGVNRALINWYQIDRTVRGVSDGASQDPYTSAVNQQEIFPERSIRPGFNDFRTFDLVYYPNRRGPYNFDAPDGYSGISAGIDLNACDEENIVLNSPNTRWGGIMRELPTTDFEQANYEAVEFWLCDPFINNPNARGGKLVLNFGTISEDVMKDNRLFYEHGLPSDDEFTRTDTSQWGKIPRIPPVVNAFSNIGDARERQDVGLDGLTDEEEASNQWYGSFIQSLQQAGLNAACLGLVQRDPANDNFAYFFDRDEYPDGTTIYNRYRKFNGTQGNSPNAAAVAGLGNTNRVAASTNIPDSEDLNRDNSLSENEAYLQLQLNINQNLESNPYVTDVVPGQNDRTWYRVRIPFTEFEKVGQINDLRSIRFMRMYMADWEEQVVLRFATFDLIRNQWRRLNRQNLACGDVPISDVLSVDAVNVEEHRARQPFRYDIPKGIQRERIIASTYSDVFQNEQSLALKFNQLEVGCEATIYKNLNLDMRVFNKMQMYIHAEQDTLTLAGGDYPDGSVAVFLRLGSDFVNNYYEYEVPLHWTREEDKILTGDEYKEALWKAANDVFFELKELTDLKIERNNTPGVSLADEYEKEIQLEVDGEFFTRMIRIKGNPTLGYVKNVQIGVRALNDGVYAGQAWVNELRMVGLEERGGVAALARMDANLADFGTVGFSTTYRSIGWGSIDKKLDDRAKESILELDVSTSLNLGKFFGQNSGIRIPFYYQYSTTIRKPQFDPLDLDLDLKEKINRATEQDLKDSLRNQALDVSSLQQINFTNVKKERTNSDKKPMPWDISNFSASYSYSKAEIRNEIVEKDELKQHRGSLDYNYSIQSKPLQPFKNLSKSPWLKFITELNFNPIPNSFTFSTVLDRRFGQRDYRFSDPIYKSWFDQRFTWDRNYGLNWDLTKSLKFTFNATNEAVIDELPVYRNRLEIEQYSEQERRDSIRSSLRNFGRTKNYSHQIRVNYSVPTKNFPFLDFIRADASYDAGYSWNAASLNTDSLGNIIQNNHTRQATLDIDFTKLYNKSKFLAKINRQSRPGGNRSASQPKARAKGSKDDESGTQGAKKKEKKKKDPNAEPPFIVKALVRPLMTIRKVRFNYTQTFGTVIPGWTPQSRLFGMGEGLTAPGWNFVGGLQPKINRRAVGGGDDFLTEATNNLWLTTNAFQNRPIEQTEVETIDGRLSLEPFKDFKIDVDINRNYTDNFSMFYKTTAKGETSIDSFKRLTPRDIGSFTMSYFSLQTLFRSGTSELRELFTTFEENRKIISEVRGNGAIDHPKDGGEYEFGYGSKSQDVILPAFVSAYTNQDPSNFELSDVFNWLPRPNWQLSYNGLHKTNLFKDIFSNVRLTHGYKSTLTINSYQSNLNYSDVEGGVVVGQQNQGNVDEVSANYYSRFIIPSFVIQEQFSPLIGFEFKTKNEMNFSFDYGKRRALSLGFISNELAEDRSTTVDIGFGYKLKNIELKFMPGYKKKRKNQKKSDDPEAPADDSGGGPIEGNDLEILFDLGFTDNITLNHYLDQETPPQPTRGSKDFTISPSIRYDINKNVNLRFFFDYRRSIPYTTTGFPTTTSNGGVTVQIVLD